MASLENRQTKAQKKRGENNYWVIFRADLHGEGSQAKFAYHAGNISKKEADQLKKGIEIGIYPSDFEMPARKTQDEYTVKAIVEHWLATYAKKLRTYEDQVGRSNLHINPVLGAQDIRDLTYADCDAFLNGLLEKPNARGAKYGNLSEQTANHVAKILRQSFKQAKVRGLVATSPMEGWKPFLIPESDRHILFVLTKDEIKQVRAIEVLSRRFICMVAIYTGLRRGEIFGLKFIDWDKSGTYPVLHVRRSYDGPTKGSRLRKVPIIPELETLLTEWKKVWPEISGTGRDPEPDDYIFPVDGSGGRMRSEHSRYKLAETIQGITGKDEQRFHDLRHTACTLMVQAGINLEVVRLAMGHSSLKITMRYVHTEDAFMATEMQKLSGRVFGKPEESKPEDGGAKGDKPDEPS